MFIEFEIIKNKDTISPKYCQYRIGRVYPKDHPIYKAERNLVTETQDEMNIQLERGKS